MARRAGHAAARKERGMRLPLPWPGAYHPPGRLHSAIVRKPARPLVHPQAMPSPRRALAVLWALPTSLPGLVMAVVALATGGRAARQDGVLEVCGGWVRGVLSRLPRLRDGGALTLGHVVLGTSRAALAATRAHERVHVAQCERWGPLFLPAYALSSLAALLAGRDPYRDNRFEREAFQKADGG